MSKVKTFASASSFRISLDERLKTISKIEKVQIQKMQRQLAFDRLLVRLFSPPSPQWALKGGYAMELRLDLARTTKDIDIAMRDEKILSTDSSERNLKLQELLQSKAGIDLGDFFEFVIKSASMDIDGARVHKRSLCYPYRGTCYLG